MPWGFTGRNEAPQPCGQHTKECTGARMSGLSQPLHPTCTWGGQHISTTYAWRLQTLLALGCGPQGHPDKEDTLLAQLLRAALYPLVAPNTHSRDFSG